MAHRPPPVGADVDTAGAHLAVGSLFKGLAVSLVEDLARPRLGEVPPEPIPLNGELELQFGQRLLRPHVHADGLTVLLPDLGHILDVELDLAHVRRSFAVGRQPAEGLFEPERLDGGRRVGRVGGEAGVGRDRVLEQAVDQVDVGTDKAEVVGDLLLDEGAVVHELLQVEGRDQAAGLAGAGGIERHHVERFAEGDVAVVHHADQRLALFDADLGGVGEDGVALQVDDMERGTRVLDEQVQQRGEGFLGVGEFAVLQETGEPADVGDDQTALFDHMHIS